MTPNTQKPDRGIAEVNPEECKGCGLCVQACPPKQLSLAERLNRYGYHPAIYSGHGCTACGICFFVCPEPGAIRVLRLVTGGAKQPESPAPEQAGREPADRDANVRDSVLVA